jgi:hypothetical protein
LGDRHVLLKNSIGAVIRILARRAARVQDRHCFPRVGFVETDQTSAGQRLKADAAQNAHDGDYADVGKIVSERD